MAIAQTILTLLAILGTGLIAGTFFVFSVAIMPAFRRLPPNEGMAAMQSINRVIQNPIFLGVFIGTALVAILLAGFSIWNWTTPFAPYALLGAILYLIGSFFVTAAFNVPLNNGLESGQVSWANYYRRWTMWNHIRTFASLASTCVFAISLASAR
jgi:uncharacterized membrane protein